MSSKPSSKPSPLSLRGNGFILCFLRLPVLDVLSPGDRSHRGHDEHAPAVGPGELKMASRILAKASALAIFVTLFGGPQADAKTLRVNLNADPSQIDPITYSELNSYQVLEQVYEGFTSITPDG